MKKFEPEPGFERLTTGFLARRSIRIALVVERQARGPKFESRFRLKFCLLRSDNANLFLSVAQVSGNRRSQVRFLAWCLDFSLVENYSLVCVDWVFMSFVLVVSSAVFDRGPDLSRPQVRGGPSIVALFLIYFGV